MFISWASCSVDFECLSHGLRQAKREDLLPPIPVYTEQPLSWTDDFIILSYRYAAQVELPLLDVVSRGPRSHAPDPSSRCGCYHDDPHNTDFFRAMLRVPYTR